MPLLCNVFCRFEIEILWFSNRNAAVQETSPLFNIPVDLIVCVSQLCLRCPCPRLLLLAWCLHLLLPQDQIKHGHRHPLACPHLRLWACHPEHHMGLPWVSTVASPWIFVVKKSLLCIQILRLSFEGKMHQKSIVCTKATGTLPLHIYYTTK